ncbi:MAG TPA: hypothetical protein VGL66_02735 [Caulobacteraceae bacterium]|jgi:hypothetical protein
MMPEVEPPHMHHSHHGAGRHLDWILPICALFVSVVSLVLALIHGQAMERMADANTRLVHANSWPLLQYTTSNLDDDNPRITLGVTNSGVGPAKLESFEVFWDGRPARNARDFLALCCGLQPGQIPAIGDARGTTAEQIAKMKASSKNGISSSQMAPLVLQAHQGQYYVGLPLNDQTAPVFQSLNGARFHVTMRACYCSVFDECWLSDLRTLHPQRTDRCPVPKVPFGY